MCVCDRERERESVCVCVRENMCVCVTERERECVCVCGATPYPVADLVASLGTCADAWRCTVLTLPSPDVLRCAILQTDGAAAALVERERVT